MRGSRLSREHIKQVVTRILFLIRILAVSPGIRIPLHPLHINALTDSGIVLLCLIQVRKISSAAEFLISRSKDESIIIFSR